MKRAIRSHPGAVSRSRSLGQRSGVCDGWVCVAGGGACRSERRLGGGVRFLCFRVRDGFDGRQRLSGGNSRMCLRVVTWWATWTVG